MLTEGVGLSVKHRPPWPHSGLGYFVGRGVYVIDAEWVGVAGADLVAEPVRRGVRVLVAWAERDEDAVRVLVAVLDAVRVPVEELDSVRVLDGVLVALAVPVAVVDTVADGVAAGVANARQGVATPAPSASVWPAGGGAKPVGRFIMP